MQLILLTPPHTVEGEIEIIKSCFSMGLEILHLRKPQFKDDDYASYLQEIPPLWRNRIVLHGARHLYPDVCSGGVHINSSEREKGLTSLFASGVPAEKLSSSFHSWKEISDADSNIFGRMFISPLFDSISKTEYKAAIVPQQITEVRSTLPSVNTPQIIGLGGISKENIHILSKLGYSGAAVMGAVWQSHSPLQSFLDILRIVA
jgi:thiamine-phosphate pyrophosphorylase